MSLVEKLIRNVLDLIWKKNWMKFFAVFFKFLIYFIVIIIIISFKLLQLNPWSLFSNYFSLKNEKRLLENTQLMNIVVF